MGTSSDGDRPWQSYHTVYTNAKADVLVLISEFPVRVVSITYAVATGVFLGMDGVDKEKVQRVIYEMSKGSKYFENEQRKDAYIKQKIERMRAQCSKLTSKDIAHFQMIADKRILELETARDLSKIWLHSDMDAFYAAVETLENPSLKEKPIAVGSMSMICTANYEARKSGVRAAMPGFIACKLCPDLVFVPTNFDKYTRYSEMTRKVFQRYDPYFIATSLDEAYMNITDTCRERGVSGQEVSEEIRNAIYEETGLTCSVGVAPNRLLAKVCSDINKPNGQFVLPNDRKAIMTFISSLPTRKIGGIGKVTEHILQDVLGISTCQDLLKKCAHLCAVFSPSSVDFFLSAGLGIGNTDAPKIRLRKSISNERTFSGTEDQTLLFQKLAEIAEALSNDMQKESLFGRTLTLKLKTASFEVRTRAMSLQKYIQSKEDILSQASRLLKAELPLSLRLLGLRMSHFRNDKLGFVDPTQKTLASFVFLGDASQSGLHANPSASGDTTDDQSISEFCCLDDMTCQQQGCKYPDDQSINAAHEGKIKTDNVVDSGKEMSCKDPLREGVEAVNETGLPDKKVVNTSVPEIFWINEYICSLCGCELPPSFIEERQEHSDYHLAEMLQNEESIASSYISVYAHRDKRTRYAGGSLRKKQRSSSKANEQIPIDLFFQRSKKP